MATARLGYVSKGKGRQAPPSPAPQEAARFAHEGDVFHTSFDSRRQLIIKIIAALSGVMGANLAPIHSQYDPIFVLTFPLSLCVYGGAPAADKAQCVSRRGARQWNARGPPHAAMSMCLCLHVIDSFPFSRRTQEKWVETKSYRTQKIVSVCHDKPKLLHIPLR